MHRLRLAIIVKCLVIGPAFAGANDEGQTPAPERAEVGLDMSFGKPVIEATVNGAGPQKFFFDTGATGMVLSKSFADELKLDVVGHDELLDPLHGKAIEVPRVRIDRLEIAGVVFANLEAQVQDRKHLYKGTVPPKGVIGLSPFADRLVTLDYPAKRVIIEEGELPGPEGREIAAYSDPDGFGGIALEVKVGDVKLFGHLDSGSMGFLAVPGKYAARLPLQGELRVIGRGRGAMSEPFEIKAARLDGAAQVGPLTFQNPELILIDQLNDLDRANIGSKLLKDYVVTIDQKNKRVRFRKP